MIMSEKFTNVLTAVHNVQQSMDVIQRGESADTGKFTYKYASLAKIWVELKPMLKINGLTIMQPPAIGTGDELETWIMHQTGEWMSTKSRLIITRDDPQGYGSAITYARRYAALSMLGLVTDDDNDATTQRLADGDMRKDWVRAYTIMSKKISPDHNPTYNDFMKFMQEVYGKHPSNILAREHQQVLDTINAFNEVQQSE